MACGGIAATSLAVALAAEATVAGAWLAVVDVPWLGVEAVAELGVPLERLVRVDPAASSERAAHGGSWADLVAAVLDGFEVVITRMPQRVNAAVLRRVQARVQAREAVLIAVGDPGPLAADITMEASTPGVGGRRARVGPPARAAGHRRRDRAAGPPARAGPSCGCPGPTAAVAPAAEPVGRCCTPVDVPIGIGRRGDRDAAPRMVTVWCPDWPVVAAGIAGRGAGGRAPRQPGRRPVTGGGRRGGGDRAPPPRQAQQRCPDVVLLDHDPARDARAFEPVVRAVGRVRPAPGGGRAGVAVPRRPRPVALLRWRRSARRAARRRGRRRRGRPATAVGVGIADGRFASAVAAWRGVRAPRVVAPGGSPAFLAPLPVAWLHHVGGVDAELVGLFARMGLARLGELAALPEGDVLARFGPPGRDAHRLARGDDDRPAGGAEPPPERRVQQTFDDPVVQLDPLVFVGKHLADELVAGLAAEGRVCTRLVVTAETDHGERSERAWYRAAGMSAPAMVERVRWQLDAWMASGELSRRGRPAAVGRPPRCAATTATSCACGAGRRRPTSGPPGPSPG